MRSNEERVAAVKERVAQLHRQKRQRRARVIALASVAASLAVIVGVSFALPGVLEGISAGGYEGYETAASIRKDRERLEPRRALTILLLSSRRE